MRHEVVQVLAPLRLVVQRRALLKWDVVRSTAEEEAKLACHAMEGDAAAFLGVAHVMEGG